jgi:organic hydroperoxide reductase OsmC/OhrA
MSDHDVHTFRTELRWAGSTGVGYEGYSRAHDLAAPPAKAALELSGDPAYRGDAERLNPEVLLVAAASSCQLLSFLAVAARARLDVVDYTDEATAIMPTGERPVRITRIDLHPRITLADSSTGPSTDPSESSTDPSADPGADPSGTRRDRPDEARLLHLVEVAHQACFIANSLSSEVVVHPTFTWRD